MRKIRILLIAVIALAFSPVASPQSEKAPRSRILMLTMYKYGFSASRVDVQPGPLEIQVRNLAGLKQLNLSFEEKAANNVSRVLKSEVVDRAASLHWQHEQVFTPGTYVLRDTTHPKWTCQIVVSAQGK